MTGAGEPVATVATRHRLQQLLRPEVGHSAAQGGYLDTLPDEEPPSPPGWAQAAWQTVAGSLVYQRLLQPMMATSVAPSMRTVAGQLGLTGGHTVADVGCGPGNVTTRLAEAVGPHGLAVGLDLSGPMLARAAVQAWPNMGLMRADATRLPLHTDSVDAACATAVVMLVPEPAHALAELLRIVAPGGPVLVMVPARPVGSLAALTRPLVDTVGRLGGARLFTPGEITSLLEQLGCQRIHTHQESSMLTVRTDAPHHTGRSQ